MTLKILLIEDSTIQSEVYKTMLERMGLDVLLAMDGSIGLEQAQNEQPDLILLDINLPGMNGIEVCSRLKSDKATIDIPVIMLTQREGAEYAMEGLEAGAEDYIAKDDFVSETLRSILQQLGMIE